MSERPRDPVEEDFEMAMRSVGAENTNGQAAVIGLYNAVTKREAEVRRLRTLIDRDVSGLSVALGKIQALVGSKMWVLDGRGSYEWDDERYRAEVGPIMREVLELCESVLRGSGTLAIAAFHPEMAVADAHRTELEQRVAKLERQIDDGGAFIGRFARIAAEQQARAAKIELLVEELLLLSEPWTFGDAVIRLVQFTTYMLMDRDYDGHGHEELYVARNVVEQSVPRIRALEAAQIARGEHAKTEAERA